MDVQQEVQNWMKRVQERAGEVANETINKLISRDLDGNTEIEKQKNRIEGDYDRDLIRKNRNEARSLVKTMLKVEDEASEIKERVTGKTSKWPKGAVNLGVRDVPEELTNDMAIAFQLMERARRERAEKTLMDRAKENQKKTVKEYDPRINIAERHNKVKEMREERKKKQAEDKIKANIQAIRTLASDDERYDKLPSDYRSSVDLRLDDLRKKKQQLQDELDPNEVQRIRELTKKETEEIKQLHKLKSDHEKFRKEREELEELKKHREQMAKEKEKVEREIYITKVKRLTDRIDTVIRSSKWRLMVHTHRKLTDFSIDLKSKELKITRRNRFRLLNKVISSWKRCVKEEKLARELEEQRKQEEYEKEISDRAEEFYEFCLYRRYIYHWKKYIYIVIKEKQAEEEAKQRKDKIESLMSFLKKKTEEPPRYEPAEIEESKDTFAISSSSVFYEPSPQASLQPSEYLQLSGLSQSSRKELKVEKPVDLKILPANSSVRSADNRAVSTTPTRSQSNTSRSSPPKAEKLRPPPPPVPKEVAEMQKRQEERKQRREELDRKYKEKRDKELQAKIEADQQKAEQEKQRKREAAERRKRVEVEVVSI